jgi:DNA-binding NtrC family response regulator
VSADPQRCPLSVAVAATGSIVHWVTSAAEALAFLTSPGAARVSLVVLESENSLGGDLAKIRGQFPHLTILLALPDARGNPSLQPLSAAEAVVSSTPRRSVDSGAGGEDSDAVCGWGRFDLRVGWSQRITPVLKQVAMSDAPVLLLGETGAGKEILARYLHAHSPREARPFLKVNCAALPADLVESELFGYERGAFTGAFTAKPGKFEIAAGGTILLDEIGDMEFGLQAKLLQILQDRTFDRLGGKEARHADVRIIAATHCDLESAVRNRRFRQDLFYRLNVITIRVPPLRERKDEILPLCELFLKRHALHGATSPSISDSLREALMAHNWPGNVRELENVIRRLLVLRDPQLIESELKLHRPQEPSTTPETEIISRPASAETHPRDLPASALERLGESKRQSEAATIRAALEAVRWNRRKAAAQLQISYKTLLYRMRKLGLTGGQPAEPAISSATEGDDVKVRAALASAAALRII